MGLPADIKKIIGKPVIIYKSSGVYIFSKIIFPPVLFFRGLFAEFWGKKYFFMGNFNEFLGLK